MQNCWTESGFQRNVRIMPTRMKPQGKHERTTTPRKIRGNLNPHQHVERVVKMPCRTAESLPQQQIVGVHPNIPGSKPETKPGNHRVDAVAMTSPDVHALCNTYHLRREELSRLSGFSLRALADWSAGKLPSLPAQRRLQEIRRLLDALAEIVQPAAIPGWMRTPNPAFDKLSPLQVIEMGEIDRLWQMVHQRA